MGMRKPRCIGGFWEVPALALEDIRELLIEAMGLVPPPPPPSAPSSPVAPAVPPPPPPFEADDDAVDLAGADAVPPPPPPFEADADAVDLVNAPEPQVFDVMDAAGDDGGNAEELADAVDVATGADDAEELADAVDVATGADDAEARPAKRARRVLLDDDDDE